jgi:hypothetical protein
MCCTESPICHAPPIMHHASLIVVHPSNIIDHPYYIQVCSASVVHHFRPESAIRFLVHQPSRSAHIPELAINCLPLCVHHRSYINRHSHTHISIHRTLPILPNTACVSMFQHAQQPHRHSPSIHPSPPPPHPCPPTCHTSALHTYIVQPYILH